MEASISTKPRNLELTQKITFRKESKINNSDRVEIPELNKKIGQPKKIEEYNQEKVRRNTTTIETII
jgi:hypothetical protein